MMRFSASSLGFECVVRNRRETSSAVGRSQRAGFLGGCAVTSERIAATIRKSDTTQNSVRDEFKVFLLLE
jgi:hypothetical protein